MDTSQLTRTVGTHNTCLMMLSEQQTGVDCYTPADMRSAGGWSSTQLIGHLFMTELLTAGNLKSAVHINNELLNLSF